MKEIVEMCKGAVYFEANPHKNIYSSAKEYIFNDVLNLESPPEISKDIIEEMIKRDTILSLQFYNITPVGFYLIYHYDYDLLIEEAKKVLNDSKNEK